MSELEEIRRRIDELVLKEAPLTIDEQNELMALRVTRNVLIDAERGARIKEGK